jgi:hypothetical protein
MVQNAPDRGHGDLVRPRHAVVQSAGVRQGFGHDDGSIAASRFDGGQRPSQVCPLPPDGRS